MTKALPGKYEVHLFDPHKVNAMEHKAAEKQTSEGRKRNQLNGGGGSCFLKVFVT